MEYRVPTLTTTALEVSAHCTILHENHVIFQAYFEYIDSFCGTLTKCAIQAEHEGLVKMQTQWKKVFMSPTRQTFNLKEENCLK